LSLAARRSAFGDRFATFIMRQSAKLPSECQDRGSARPFPPRAVIPTLQGRCTLRPLRVEAPLWPRGTMRPRLGKDRV
jgi:hypothetical protein